MLIWGVMEVTDSEVIMLISPGARPAAVVLSIATSQALLTSSPCYLESHFCVSSSGTFFVLFEFYISTTFYNTSRYFWPLSKYFLNRLKFFVLWHSPTPVKVGDQTGLDLHKFNAFLSDEPSGRFTAWLNPSHSFFKVKTESKGWGISTGVSSFWKLTDKVDI